MPCVEVKIAGIPLTADWVSRLQAEITAVLQEHIAPAFARCLNYPEGSREFAVALAVARQIMPGWTWVSVVSQEWAVRGRPTGSEAVVARFHILVLAGALSQAVRQDVAQAIADLGMTTLGQGGKPVQLFVDVIEGEVDMTLPADLFGNLVKGARHQKLKVDEIMKFYGDLVLQQLTHNGSQTMFEKTGRAAAASPLAALASSKGKIGVLVEDHFDGTEYWKFNGFFQAHGYDVQYLSHLWDQPALRFGSNPENDRIEFHVTVPRENEIAPKVDGSEKAFDFTGYRGIILIGAYAMDRARYEEHPQKGQPNQSPAVKFLRAAMNTPSLKIGTICHSLWLFCAAPDLLEGRKVTCAHNIICDVENAGGDVQFGSDGTVELVVDGNLITGKHPAYVDQLLARFLEEIEKTY
jgi:putative intracellular protease/amidase/phenylpyruvate tautomerase PptA (4-oxalocrotonate tautomerase family)